MKIRVTKPHETEARCEDDEGGLTIQPIFRSPMETKPFLYISIMGGNGETRKFAIQVSARDGRVSAPEMKEVIPVFDLPVEKRTSKGAK